MALTLQSMWQTIVEATDRPYLLAPAQSLTYRDFGSLVAAELQRFDDAGLEPGDRVLICTADEMAAIALFTTALLDGLVPVMLAPETPDERLAAISSVVEPGLTCRGASPHAPSHGRAPRLPDTPDALAYILFTSGTTQSPSGVTISHRNLLANVATLSRLFGYDADSRIFNDMVLAHADGFIQGPLIALANGATLIRSGSFSIAGMETWLGRVREMGATHVITVPTVWSLINRYARRDDYFQGSECRALLSVAAKLDTALWERLESRFGRPVYNQYGLTETVASALYAGPQREMGPSGTIGKPVDCEARIAAPSADGAGELQLRGDNIFPGYWKNPARTAESFTQDGWFKTGDVVRKRPDGAYEILGRLKTIIMMAGFLIRPEEIDEALLTHPAVAEAVTVALPDGEFGEIPATAVVLQEAASEADLTAHARRTLEPLKVPKRIVILDAMPRGISGKPDIKAILKRIEATVAEEQIAPQPADQDTANNVLRIASRVFRVDPTQLRLESNPTTVKGWDSFSHVTLLLAAEAQFGVEIAADHATDIKSLGDLVAAITRHQALNA